MEDSAALEEPLAKEAGAPLDDATFMGNDGATDAEDVPPQEDATPDVDGVVDQEDGPGLEELLPATGASLDGEDVAAWNWEELPTLEVAPGEPLEGSPTGAGGQHQDQHGNNETQKHGRLPSSGLRKRVVSINATDVRDTTATTRAACSCWRPTRAR